MFVSKANVNAQVNKIMMKILASIEQKGKKNPFIQAPSLAAAHFTGFLLSGVQLG